MLHGERTGEQLDLQQRFYKKHRSWPHERRLVVAATRGGSASLRTKGLAASSLVKLACARQRARVRLVDTALLSASIFEKDLSGCCALSGLSVMRLGEPRRMLVPGQQDVLRTQEQFNTWPGAT